MPAYLVQQPHVKKLELTFLHINLMDPFSKIHALKWEFVSFGTKNSNLLTDSPRETWRCV